jgi:uncharacterized protein involved in oxidation of intracellular sulfur
MTSFRFGSSPRRFSSSWIGIESGAARQGGADPGYYNLEVMLGAVAKRGGEIVVCGTCMDARGIAAEELAEGAHRGTLEQLAEWTVAADRVLVF